MAASTVAAGFQPASKAASLPPVPARPAASDHSPRRRPDHAHFGGPDRGEILPRSGAMNLAHGAAFGVRPRKRRSGSNSRSASPWAGVLERSARRHTPIQSGASRRTPRRWRAGRSPRIVPEGARERWRVPWLLRPVRGGKSIASPLISVGPPGRPSGSAVRGRPCGVGAVRGRTTTSASAVER